MCEHCEWFETLELIGKMLNAGEAYSFAADTLKGIRDTIDERGHVTTAQQQAVENIRASRDPRRGGVARMEP